VQGWLKLLYTSRCKKYEQGASLEATLEALENEPPNGQQQQQQAGGDAAAAAASGSQQQQFQQQQIAGPSGGAGGGSSLQTPDKGRLVSAGPQPMALSPVQEEPSGGGSGGSSAAAAAAAGGAAVAPGAPGWGMSDNLDVIACRAEWLYHRCASHPLLFDLPCELVPAFVTACSCWRLLLSRLLSPPRFALVPHLSALLPCGCEPCRNAYAECYRLTAPPHFAFPPVSPTCPCRGAYAECYRLTAAALERDPYATECLPPHLASALELGKKNELFLRGHK
jgi:hypothetical protein